MEISSVGKKSSSCVSMHKGGELPFLCPP